MINKSIYVDKEGNFGPSEPTPTTTGTPEWQLIRNTFSRGSELNIVLETCRWLNRKHRTTVKIVTAQNIKPKHDLRDPVSNCILTLSRWLRKKTRRVAS